MAERQMAKRWEEIRGDHRGRYVMASHIVEGNIFDAACGCGYGSHYLALSDTVESVVGADIAQVAIDYAKLNWAHPKIAYMLLDLQSGVLPVRGCDWITAFEILEHLQRPEVALQTLRDTAQHMLCSVPNEETMPFDAKRFPFHVRHYTPRQFEDLLAAGGWRLVWMKSQPGAMTETVELNTTGRTLVARCERI